MRKIACAVAAGTLYAALPYQRHHVLLRATLLHKLCVLCVYWLDGQAIAVTDLHGIPDLSITADWDARSTQQTTQAVCSSLISSQSLMTTQTPPADRFSWELDTMVTGGLTSIML